MVFTHGNIGFFNGVREIEELTTSIRYSTIPYKSIVTLSLLRNSYR
jgi:hypothetical protein